MNYWEMTRREWSDLHGTEGGGEMLTKQADKDAADINIIVRTYGTSNQFANVNPIEPRYQDNTAVVDLIEARNLVQQAEQDFLTLPAEVRALANNDPVQFLEMLTDEGAVEALKARGLPIKETPPKSSVESLLERVVENTTPKEQPK